MSVCAVNSIFNLKQPFNVQNRSLFCFIKKKYVLCVYSLTKWEINKCFHIKCCEEPVKKSNGSLKSGSVLKEYHMQYKNNLYHFIVNLNNKTISSPVSAFGDDVKHAQSHTQSVSIARKYVQWRQRKHALLVFGPWDKEPVEICGNISITLLIGTCT